ncbi:MAG TPA: DNA repair protein RecO [Dehalococcoidia bacterium]|nr:DNA repair protein RecO [Dehalococcoidia bacterium]
MPPPRLYKTEAVVLRQRRLGEADRIIILLTPLYGKLDVKARGVRKTTSRMGGFLQPLTRCMVQLARGHTWDVVAGCQALETFRSLREDLDRLGRALYAAELTDRFSQERAEAHSTYRLLLDTLRRLDALSRGDSQLADLLLRHFELRLLDQAGFRPQLQSCVLCEGSLEPGGQVFVPSEGGVVCSRCLAGLAGPRQLSVDALKLLRLLQRAPWDEVSRIRIGPELAREVEYHLRSYIVYTLERDVNAAAFLERLRRGEFLEPAAPA